jgi:hypothetical protein
MKAHLVDVERLRPVDVGDGDKYHLKLPVHMRSVAAPYDTERPGTGLPAVRAASSRIRRAAT